MPAQTSLADNILYALRQHRAYGHKGSRSLWGIAASVGMPDVSAVRAVLDQLAADGHLIHEPGNGEFRYQVGGGTGGRPDRWRLA